MWSNLLAFFLQAGPIVFVRLAKVFGVGFVTFQGFGWLIDYLRTNIFSNFESLPAKVFQICVMTGVDQALVIVLSGIAMAFFIRTVGTGSATKLTAGIGS